MPHHAGFRLDVLQSTNLDTRTLLDGADGRVLEPGTSAYLSIHSSHDLTSALRVDQRVRVGTGNRRPVAEIRRLTASLHFSGWALTAGRSTWRLGRGTRGRLLLDDNAPAFDMVALAREEGFRLPGPLASWGTFDFEIVNGVLPRADDLPADARFLTEGRAVARPSLLAMRLSYAPRSWLEFGVTRTALYGGEGREAYDTFGEWWDLLTARNENAPGPDGRFGSDQLASFDLRVDAPWLDERLPFENSHYYLEYGGTDIHASWQGDRTPSIFPMVLTDVAVLQGGALTVGSTQLSIEHVRVHRDWYRHDAYPQGYTNGGLALGHVVGADAAAWSFGVDRPIGSVLRASASLLLTETFRSSPSPIDGTTARLEARWKLGTYGRWVLTPGLRIDSSNVLLGGSDPDVQSNSRWTAIQLTMSGAWVRD